jgi:hypothetical protein
VTRAARRASARERFRLSLEEVFDSPGAYGPTLYRCSGFYTDDPVAGRGSWFGLLYIGIAKDDLCKRFRGHQSESKWLPDVLHVDVERYTRAELRAGTLWRDEHRAIGSEQPIHNCERDKNHDCRHHFVAPAWDDEDLWEECPVCGWGWYWNGSYWQPGEGPL